MLSQKRRRIRLHCVTYTLIDLMVDRQDDPVNAAPLVLVLRPSTDHAEAFQDVNYVINASSLHAELFGALVEIEYTLSLDAVVVQKAPAQFSQTLLLAVIHRAHC